MSLLPVVSAAVEEGLLRWLRAAELTCDRAALLVAQDRWVCAALCYTCLYSNTQSLARLTRQEEGGMKRGVREHREHERERGGGVAVGAWACWPVLS